MSAGPRGGDSPVHAKQVRRILASEGGHPADAAAGVYDEFVAQLAPLLGKLGIQALLKRSARLASGQFPALADPSVAESSAALGKALHGLEPAAAEDAAAALFGRLLSLLTTFIGERLTNQALRASWPAFDESDPKEKHR